MDGTWSETGDRYMLKLFRDYLFHTVTEDGLPWLDHAHIVQCLNKLDAGTMERVSLLLMLSSTFIRIIIIYYSNLYVILKNISGAINVQRRTIHFNCYLCRTEALFGAGILRAHCVWMNVLIHIENGASGCITIHYCVFSQPRASK